MELPFEFKSRMQRLLRKEADTFFESYQQKHTYGLRMNPLKYNTQFSKKELPFTLTPVAWAEEGFYAVPEEHPGRHPFHEGGAYYIQEPSAMSVASLLSSHAGDKVCDLCAAPGGKSTQIAGQLLGTGLLVANEISPARAKILSQNIERCGIGNCVVCSESPDKMAEHFPLFFNKIVVDAPCSGEGMFRKDGDAAGEWSVSHIKLCSERQQMILDCADRMLSEGGIMVYSTCTFAPEEDEQIVAWFLQTHPNYVLEDWRQILKKYCEPQKEPLKETDKLENHGLEGGRTDFLNEEMASCSHAISNTLRLWPHKVQGEGHFAARLRKKEKPYMYESMAGLSDKRRLPSAARKKTQKAKSCRKPDITEYLLFAKQFLHIRQESDSYTITKVLSDNDNYQYFGEELYLVPASMNSLQGLKVVRAGLHLGTRKKNRFEPAHALAMALHPEDAIQSIECTEDEAAQYLKGNTLPCAAELKAWTLVCYKGVSLGWGKAANGILKNHYPKGLRIMS